LIRRHAPVVGRLGAPLFLGTDLAQMDRNDPKLTSNCGILAIDQRGIPAPLAS
jgi:hypothetical protein